MDFNDAHAIDLSLDFGFGSFPFLMERTARKILRALRWTKYSDASFPRPELALITMMVLPEKHAVGEGGLKNN